MNIQKIAAVVPRSLWRFMFTFFSLPVLLRMVRAAGKTIQGLHKRLQPSRISSSHSCLANSVLAVFHLQKKGIENRLAIGVKKENGKLLAHAWVEKDKESFDEREGFKKLGTF